MDPPLADLAPKEVADTAPATTPPPAAQSPPSPHLPSIAEEAYLCHPVLVKSLERSERAHKVNPVGITNSENNCFINCVFQCLTYSTPLFIYLSRKLHSKRCTTWEFCAYCKLETFVSLMVSTDAKRYVLRVDDFLFYIHRFGEFKRGLQDDASLFLTGLAMKLQAEEFRRELSFARCVLFHEVCSLHHVCHLGSPSRTRWLAQPSLLPPCK
jgi:hypothetical protein